MRTETHPKSHRFLLSKAAYVMNGAGNVSPIAAEVEKLSFKSRCFIQLSISYICYIQLYLSIIVSFRWRHSSILQVLPASQFFRCHRIEAVAATEVLTSQDGEAAQRLRVMPAHQQRMVMNRGPIGGSRLPSAVCWLNFQELVLKKLASRNLDETGSKIDQLILKDGTNSHRFAI